MEALEGKPMLVTRNRLAVGAAFAGALLMTAPAHSEGLVDMSFNAPEQSVMLGDTVYLSIMVQSDGVSETAFNGIQASLSWDPDVLLLVGADDTASGANWYYSGFLFDPDGINDAITDGDALYIAVTPPGDEAMAPVDPDELLITTLEFEAVGAGTDSPIIFLPENGYWGATLVMMGAYDVTGDFSSVATVTVTDPNADPCPADLDGDGSVGTNDLLALLAAWGDDPGGPPDFDGDGTVSTSDLLYLVGAWGACP
jgi:hypothetical protein